MCIRDSLDGMLNKDESVPGVPAALRLFEKRVRILRASNRFAGDEALQLIRKPDGLVEVLVKQSVPLEVSIREIVNNEQIMK